MLFHFAEARVHALLYELFRLQDLNSDGYLQEDELVLLNERIAILHYGEGVDIAEIRQRYTTLFRERLDPSGSPVPFSTFCDHMVEVLGNIDRDFNAQEMVVEQFIVEASLARCFLGCGGEESEASSAHCSTSTLGSTSSERSADDDGGDGNDDANGDFCTEGRSMSPAHPSSSSSAVASSASASSQEAEDPGAALWQPRSSTLTLCSSFASARCSYPTVSLDGPFDLDPDVCILGGSAARDEAEGSMPTETLDMALEEEPRVRGRSSSYSFIDEAVIEAVDVYLFGTLIYNDCQTACGDGEAL